jgi:phosphatidylserine/phosphatidylglycerophosphate/cardiolipin synthase-like enzyme
VALPTRGESFIQAMNRAAARGVDVRLLFWWSEYAGIGSFRGDPHELDGLRELGCRVKMRWDDVPRGCHHQKSYVIDGETAFVGGINVTREALSGNDHEGSGFHDLFAELRGPAVADVARNFVERWNQASVTRTRGHAYPSLNVADDLAGIVREPTHAGSTRVQLVRTLRRGLYTGTSGWEEHDRFELADGEDAIERAVNEAIGRARRRVYLENQFLMDPGTIDALAAAAGRGVEIIGIVPLEPDPNLLLYPEAKMRETHAALERLAELDNVGLFGLAHEHETARTIYVHAKLLIVDDREVHIG